MAVKLRLARKGRKHSAFYHLVAADARAPRDGRNLGKVGTYDPNKDPAPVQLDVEAILSWLEKGAQPTSTVRQILSSQGVLLKRHLQRGVDKGVITQAMADKSFAAWEKAAIKKKRRPYQNAQVKLTLPTDTVEKPATATKAKKEPVAKKTKVSATPTPKGATKQATAKASPKTKPTKAKKTSDAVKEKEATPPEKRR